MTAFDLESAPCKDDLTIAEFVELGEQYGIRPQDLDGETPLRSLVESDDPSAATRAGVHWLVHRRPQSAESHLATHGILPPEEATEADLPPTDHESIRALDAEALSEGLLSGKWNVFCSPDEVDDRWRCVRTLVDENVVSSAKVSTKWGRESKGRDSHVIVVYTPNYFDTDDVFRVRESLRARCGFDATLYYKPDLWTTKGIYGATAAEYGLPRASRYAG